MTPSGIPWRDLVWNSALLYGEALDRSQAGTLMNERSIFIAALDQDSRHSRSEYLDSACAGDTALRERVEALLESHEKASGFLARMGPERLAEELAAGETSDFTHDDSPMHEDTAEELAFLTPTEKPGSLGTLGHYDIQEVVGRGGMGVVLRAFDERLHRVVAIKVMAAQLATSATARKRFTREAQAAAAVSHDHLVTIHAVEEANGRPYIAMQYVAGLSLEERIWRDGPLALHEILRIGMQTASGLAAAHAQGLIHRDIKPANILLENGVERVKITDFGLARAVADASLTQTGAVAGTPHYMAPEQARGDALDARTDLFSLGSVLYAMCTGRTPFRASNSMAVLKRVCEETPTSIRQTNPEIPDWLVSIIEKLHAKDPAERFQTAAEVAELLSRHLAHVQHPSVAPLPAVNVGAASRAAPGPARLAGPTRRWVLAAAALLVCLSLGGLSLTEATGVTNFRATIIRIFTPDGTLIVEVDDPAVKVTVEGDGGLVITGAGPQEVRLKPGSYKVVATKDGRPVKREVVTITRGGKQVVNVSLEEQVPATASQSSGEVRRFIGHTAGVQSVAISAGGRRIVSGSDDKTVRLWDLKTGKELRRFEGHSDKVYSVAFSPDGSRVLSGSFDTTVRLWDVATGTELRRFSGHTDLVYCVAYAPDGRRALSGGNDNTVRLWDVENGEELRRFEGHSRPLYSVAFSPDGRRALSGSWDKTMRLWDVESGQELRRFDGHEDVIKSVAFSPDGRRALSAGGKDKSVRLWDLETGEELRRFEGHKDWAHSAAFSSDGLRVVSGGTLTVYLWDVPSGRLLQSFPGHTGEVADVAYAPDGRHVLSAGWAYGDNTLRLWQLPEAAAVQLEATPFVVLTGKAVTVRSYASLAEAVVGASEGDTIEIHGNGPFETNSIAIKSALSIRAGEGYRPLIKLSVKAAASDHPLFKASDTLVLEGLDLFRPKGTLTGTLVDSRGSVAAANCRFRVEGLAHCIFTDGSWTTRNCMFLGGQGFPTMQGTIADGAKYSMYNCVDIGTPFVLPYQRSDTVNVAIQLMNNTLAAKGIGIQAHGVTNIEPGATGPKPFRFDVSGNIFGSDLFRFQLTSAFLTKYKGFEPEKTGEAVLRSLVDWNERENLHAPGRRYLTWVMDQDLQPSQRVKTLADWQEIWELADTGSVEGRAKYQGGDVLAKLVADPDGLTPDDFRLREDSPGYRTGADGNDLGADVDLVGPGAAYERWKKTPEYQEWLKETGQVRAEAPKAESQAFVVLDGKGIEVRKYDTLIEAVQGASDGDTIEIRGNGPFETETVSVNAALTIRAGEGFRPRITSSAKVARDQPLFKARGRLVLEGLDLYRPTGLKALVNSQGLVAAANCRFHVGGALRIWTMDSCTTRNCLFLGGDVTMNGFIPDGATYAMHNCVDTGTPFSLPYHRDGLHLRVQLTHNTIVARTIGIQAREITNPLPGAKGPKPIRVDASGNIFGSDYLWFQLTSAYLAKHNGFEPEKSGEALLRSLVDWNERENLHAPGRTCLTWVMGETVQPSQRVKTLAEWQQFWGLAGTGSLEGRAKYKGGDVLAKFATDPDRITSDDFRLRPDSPGYRAGKDGKDLGADVDLVGPGAAYDRWKKTPEYQVWLDETGAVKNAEVAPTELDTAKRELARWQGEWESSDQGKLAISGDRWCWRPAEGPEVVSTIKIVEVAEKMNHVLLLNTGLDGKVRTIQAILHIDGDTLHNCGTIGPIRPTEFANKPGYLYTRWKRASTPRR